MLKSKTVWAGIALIITGSIMIYEGDSNGVQTVIQGLAVIFARKAIEKNKN